MILDGKMSGLFQASCFLVTLVVMSTRVDIPDNGDVIITEPVGLQIYCIS